MAHDGDATTRVESDDNCPECGHGHLTVALSDPKRGAPGPHFGQEPEGLICQACDARFPLPDDHEDEWEAQARKEAEREAEAQQAYERARDRRRGPR